METEKFYVEQINILGNDITQENVIRDSLEVDEGDPFNELLHAKSLNNLKSKNIFKTVDLVKPQIIALGYDQTHQEKFITEGCKKINLDVIVARLESPRPETSSSVIQKEYGEDIHGL